MEIFPNEQSEKLFIIFSVEFVDPENNPSA